MRELKVPLTLSCQNTRSGIEKFSDFEVRFDGEWQEYYREDDPNSQKSSEERKNEEFKRIVAHYRNKRLENKDIYPILGIGKESYAEYKRKVGLVGK